MKRATKMMLLNRGNESRDRQEHDGMPTTDYVIPEGVNIMTASDMPLCAQKGITGWKAGFVIVMDESIMIMAGFPL